MVFLDRPGRARAGKAILAGHASKRMSHVQLAGIAELTQRSRPESRLPFLLRHNIDTPLAEYVDQDAKRVYAVGKAFNPRGHPELQ